MGYLLREALKTLCGVNQWSYAVFWKFGYQNPKLLIWEECYYEPAIPETTLQDYDAPSVLAETHNLWPGVQARDNVNLIVNKMMMDNHVKIVGEGLVGRVAFTGRHQWVLTENYYTEPHPPEVLEEIRRQFSGGMQTLAVIPVLPHGVVQFGSKLKITENVGFVNEVVSLVLELGCVPGVFLGYSTPEDLPLNSNMIDSSSLVTDTYVGSSAQTPLFDGQTSHSLAREVQNNIHPNLASFQASNASPFHFKPSDGLREADNQFINQLAKAEIIPSNEEIQKNSELNTRKEEIEQRITQSGDDLFNILGADFKNNIFSDCCKWDNKSDMSSTGQENMCPGIFSSTDTDNLLDAVVSKVYPSSKQSLDDTVSCTTTLTNKSSSVGPNASLPHQRVGVSDFQKGESLGNPKYLANSGAMSSSKEDPRTYSQCSSVYNPGQKGNSTKPHETSKTNRKRLKPGENPRPRPRDRQLIQDRLKELREIIPQGAKCPIDALLERTIKHMHFLQSVAKHADKLKHTSESKIICEDGGLLLKDSFEGGATWAYEVGSQSPVCPIIVKDLNEPRQMLIEMLFEERGLFLEIADLLRGLGLTILKGLMENQNDKIGARFVVEANRDVTRLEIFLPLVRLLEQSAKDCVAQPNNMCNNKNMIVQQFQQATTVPATGSM